MAGWPTSVSNHLPYNGKKTLMTIWWIYLHTSCIWEFAVIISDFDKWSLGAWIRLLTSLWTEKEDTLPSWKKIHNENSRRLEKFQWRQSGKKSAYVISKGPTMRMLIQTLPLWWSQMTKTYKRQIWRDMRKSFPCLELFHMRSRAAQLLEMLSILTPRWIKNRRCYFPRRFEHVTHVATTTFRVLLAPWMNSKHLSIFSSFHLAQVPMPTLVREKPEHDNLEWNAYSDEKNAHKEMTESQQS